MSKISLSFHSIREHYLFLLFIIIIVFLLNEATMFKTYQDNTNTADIINQAGRQRMFSQKIAKLTLHYKSGDTFALKELQETVTRWSLAHESFMDENSSLSRFYYSSKLISDNFKKLDNCQKAIEYAVNEMVSKPEIDHSEYIAIVMKNEPRFLALMDTIVNQMETEASQSYYKITMISFTIAILTILGIALIIFFLMQPIINSLRYNEKLLTASIAEKEALLVETHHRVKNNLAIVSGIIQLQLMKNEFSKKTFEDAIDRVQSIASIHEFLYNEKEYSTVNIDQYINELIKKLSDSYPQLGSRIRVHVIADTIEFNTEKAVPFSLLLNELITNSLKHAFKEGDIGQIDIILTENSDKDLFFKYQDNGRGVLLTKNDNTGIGMQLMEALAQQLNCKLDISFAPSFMLTTTIKL